MRRHRTWALVGVATLLVAVWSAAPPLAVAQTSYLNPSTGRECVEPVDQRTTDLSSAYQRRIEYRVTFSNSCSGTFRIVGEITPAPTYSGGSYNLTRTTGISGYGRSDLVCQDDGGSTACRGWSGYEIQ